jgi:translation initiation factor eIF-2B subunit beta
LIIAEASPSLDGHKLAHSLCKVPNISITIIPDSNLYAIMARVNKVILSPHAVMADGGTIAPSGHLMVSLAAKEFLVPVVCISSSFSLTPLFAHNQSLALQQLQSPADTIRYEENIDFSNVEVRNTLSFLSFFLLPVLPLYRLFVLSLIILLLTLFLSL